MSHFDVESIFCPDQKRTLDQQKNKNEIASKTAIKNFFLGVFCAKTAFDELIFGVKIQMKRTNVVKTPDNGGKSLKLIISWTAIANRGQK